MGKGNRNRNERNLNKASNPGTNAKKDKSGIIAAVVVAVVVVIVVCSFVFSTLISNGTFDRKNIAVKSENYEFNQLMMSYMFHSTYNSFYQNYYQLIAYGLIKLDTTKPLSSQTYETDANGNVTTWYDYFMENTVHECKEILVYCEKAKEAGVSLDEFDVKKIDKYVSDIKDDIKTQASSYGYSENYVLQSYYGESVSYDDIRNCVELMYLSSKYQQIVSDDFSGKITDERIEQYFLDNYGDFFKADYMTYTLSATLETFKTSDFAETDANGKAETDADGNVVYDKEAYESAIAEAESRYQAEKEKIDAAKEGIAKLYENESYIADYVRSITEKAGYAETDAEGNAETDANGTIIYDEVAYESAVAEAIESFDSKDEDYIAWAIEEYVFNYLKANRIDDYNEKYYESLAKQRETETDGTLSDSAKKEIEDTIDEYIRDDAKLTFETDYAYNTNTGLGVWVFGPSDAVVIDETNKTVTLGGGAKNLDMIFDSELPEGETESETDSTESTTETETETETESETKADTSYSFTVYVLTSEASRSEAGTKDIAYMLFANKSGETTSADDDELSEAESRAADAYNKVMAESELDEDKFDDIAFFIDADYHSIVHNLKRGTFGYDIVDQWAFDYNGEEHHKGDVNWLDLGDYIALVYYIGDGKTEWVADAYDAILSADNNEWLEAAEEEVTVIVDSNICYKVKG